MSLGARVVVAVAASLLLLGGCNDDGPALGDVRTEAYLVYPGATETERHWRGEEHGRSVDGNDLSHVAQLYLLFQLDQPVTNSAIWDWYEQQLATRGWSRAPSSSLNHAMFDQRVGNRSHSLDVEAGRAPDDLVTGFSVYYSISFGR